MTKGKVGIELSSDLGDLSMFYGKERQHQAELEVYQDDLQVRVKSKLARSVLSIAIPIKEILETLALDLPLWAVKSEVKEVEKRVEVPVEVKVPVLELGLYKNCRECKKESPDAILTKDGLFCSWECHQTWKKKSNLPRVA